MTTKPTEIEVHLKDGDEVVTVEKLEAVDKQTMEKIEVSCVEPLSIIKATALLTFCLVSGKW